MSRKLRLIAECGADICQRVRSELIDRDTLDEDHILVRLEVEASWKATLWVGEEYGGSAWVGYHVVDWFLEDLSGEVIRDRLNLMGDTLVKKVKNGDTSGIGSEDPGLPGDGVGGGPDRSGAGGKRSSGKRKRVSAGSTGNP